MRDLDKMKLLTNQLFVIICYFWYCYMKGNGVVMVWGWTFLTTTPTARLSGNIPFVVRQLTTTTTLQQQQQQQRYGQKARSSFLVGNYGMSNQNDILVDDITMNSSSSIYDYNCDFLILGSGPAARAIASLLSSSSSSSSQQQQQKYQVLLADQNLDNPFVPNYGVWKHEWDTVCEAYKEHGVSLYGGRVGKAIDYEWSITDCYFGGSFNIPTKQRLRLSRPYQRIDRYALRSSLSSSSSSNTNSNNYQEIKANHISQAVGINIYHPSGSLIHDSTGSTIQLQTKEGKIITVRCQLIIDCTGHETKLILRESKESPQGKPGYQIAYGMLVNVTTTTTTTTTANNNNNNNDNDNIDDECIGPYDKQAMTLFDYRTDHYDSSTQANQDKVTSAPTFMYAMPLGDNQIFFEETSLVARPAISFQECKDRCYQRLNYLGIQVQHIYEEEFCSIPMGGPLPAKDQRIIGMGGSATMVHPSTGYHLCRCLIGARDMAQAIHNEFQQQQQRQQQQNIIANTTNNIQLDRVAAVAYHALWTPEAIRQRNFAVFGGEFLMQQNVMGLRGFFDGFFRLPMPLWSGFLAGWKGLPYNDKHESWWARLTYGLIFVTKLPPIVAIDLIANIVGYSVKEGIPLLQSVTPFWGEPSSYEYKYDKSSTVVGDVAAKVEARKMIQASTVEDRIPVAFTTTTTKEEGTNVAIKSENNDDDNNESMLQPIVEDESTKEILSVSSNA